MGSGSGEWVGRRHVHSPSPNPQSPIPNPPQPRRARSAAPALRNPDPLDLPLEFDPLLLAHATADLLAQSLDIRGARPAVVDQEVAVHLGDLRVPAAKAAAAGRFDQLPG